MTFDFEAGEVVLNYTYKIAYQYDAANQAHRSSFFSLPSCHFRGTAPIANLTPGSIHKVIETPEGELKNTRAISI